MPCGGRERATRAVTHRWCVAPLPGVLGSAPEARLNTLASAKPSDWAITKLRVLLAAASHATWRWAASTRAVSSALLVAAGGQRARTQAKGLCGLLAGGCGTGHVDATMRKFFAKVARVGQAARRAAAYWRCTCCGAHQPAAGWSSSALSSSRPEKRLLELSRAVKRRLVNASGLLALWLNCAQGPGIAVGYPARKTHHRSQRGFELVRAETSSPWRRWYHDQLADRPQSAGSARRRDGRWNCCTSPDASAGWGGCRM